MQHLLLLYLIISLLPGIAALTVLSALVSRFKNRALTYFLIAYSSFTASILINLTMFYLGINISEDISFGVYSLIALGIPFSILMHTMLPLAVNEATNPPGKRIIDGIIILVSILELSLFCTPLLMRFSKETNTLLFGPIFPLSSIIEMISIGYSIAVIIILRKKITNVVARKYILALIIIIAAFLPAIGYDQFYFVGITSINKVPIGIILSPIFYMVLSLVTAIFGARILRTIGKIENSIYVPNEKIIQPSLESKIHNLAVNTGLSEREIMIIPLISEGLGKQTNRT